MRPPGQVRLALATAARALVRHEGEAIRGGTMKEIAGHAGVAYSAARDTVKNMTRVGELACISGRRKVKYRNKPVAEYLPKDVAAEIPPDPPGDDAVDFGDLIAAWK